MVLEVYMCVELFGGSYYHATVKVTTALSAIQHAP